MYMVILLIGILCVLVVLTMIGFAPNSQVFVTQSGGKKKENIKEPYLMFDDHIIKHGQIIPLGWALKAPSFKLGNPNLVGLTALMVDLDAPGSKGTKNRYLHWLVVNGTTNKKKKTPMTIIQKYIPAAPPKGSGVHRYHVIVYQQKNRLNKADVNVVDNTQFNLKRFVNEHGLTEITKFVFRIAS